MAPIFAAFQLSFDPAGVPVSAGIPVVQSVVMSRYVDYDAEATSIGRCIVLPGRRYSPDGPLLFFVTQTALARGWDVRQVWWEAPEWDNWTMDDEIAWVAGELDTAAQGRLLTVPPPRCSP